MDDIHLHLLAHKLENYWKRLGRRLRFDDAELVVFDRSNDNLIEKALVMLLKWKSREGLKSSYQALHDALCHPLVNRRDLAFEICIDASPFWWVLKVAVVSLSLARFISHYIKSWSPMNNRIKREGTFQQHLSFRNCRQALWWPMHMIGCQRTLTLKTLNLIMRKKKTKLFGVRLAHPKSKPF